MGKAGEIPASVTTSVSDDASSDYCYVGHETLSKGAGIRTAAWIVSSQGLVHGLKHAPYILIFHGESGLCEGVSGKFSP